MGDVALGAALGVAATLAWSAFSHKDDVASAIQSGAEPHGAAAEAAPALSARALSVIDGDTFEARVATFPGQEIVTRVRIAGVDAPERAGRCASETEAAAAATAALSQIIEGRRLTLTGVHGDKYFGRVVARVATDAGGDVADALIAEGHGRAYAGGRRGGWC